MAANNSYSHRASAEEADKESAGTTGVGVSLAIENHTDSAAPGPIRGCRNVSLQSSRNKRLVAAIGRQWLAQDVAEFPSGLQMCPQHDRQRPEITRALNHQTDVRLLRRRRHQIAGSSASARSNSPGVMSPSRTGSLECSETGAMWDASPCDHTTRRESIGSASTMSALCVVITI